MSTHPRRMPKATSEPLTPDEVERVLAAARSARHGVRDHAMLLTLYHHGLRVSELCRLTRPTSTSKRARSGSSGSTAGSPVRTRCPKRRRSARGVSRGASEGRELELPALFLNERRAPLSRNAVYYLIRRAGEVAGIDGRSIHTCSATRRATSWWATVTTSARPGVPWPALRSKRAPICLATRRERLPERNVSRDSGGELIACPKALEPAATRRDAALGTGRPGAGRGSPEAKRVLDHWLPPDRALRPDVRARVRRGAGAAGRAAHRGDHPRRSR